MLRRLTILLLPVCLLTAPDQVQAQSEASAKIRFLRDVAPILNRRCTGCHGPRKTEGGYRLHAFANLMTAGESEESPVVAGKPQASEIFRRLIETDENLRMPQLDDSLSAEEIALIRNWIEQGAKFDGSDAKASYRTIMPPREHPAAPEKYRRPVPVQAVTFSPDGGQLAVSGYHEVTVWNPATGRLIGRIGKLPQRQQALSFSRDGSKLLIGGGTPGDYGEVCLVKLNSPLKKGSDPLEGVLEHDNTGGPERVRPLFQRAVKTGQRDRVLGTFEDIVLDAAFSPDESFVAAGSADRSVRAWKTEDGKQIWDTLVHSDWVTGISVSHDGRFVASSSRDFTVKIHDAKTGSLFTTFNGHQRQYGQFTGRFRVYDVEFSRDGPQAFSAGQGQAIRIWEAEKARAENGTAGDMEARFAKKGHTKYIDYGSKKTVYQVCVEKGHVFVATGDGRVSQFESASAKRIRDFVGHAERVFCVTAHSKSERLASGSFDGEVRIWNTKSGKLISAFKASPGFETHTAQAE